MGEGGREVGRRGGGREGRRLEKEVRSGEEVGRLGRWGSEVGRWGDGEGGREVGRWGNGVLVGRNVREKACDGGRREGSGEEQRSVREGLAAHSRMPCCIVSFSCFLLSNCSGLSYRTSSPDGGGEGRRKEGREGGREAGRKGGREGGREEGGREGGRGEKEHSKKMEWEIHVMLVCNYTSAHLQLLSLFQTVLQSNCCAYSVPSPQPLSLLHLPR